VEHHGNNPPKNVVAIIPARYSSVRLPGKMLLPIAGKPLILHTVDRAREASTIGRVIVATDDVRIFDAVMEAGAEAIMTSPDHASGSDRIAEVAEGLPSGSIVVNVQGDEPVIPAATIDAAVRALLSKGVAQMATTFETCNNADEVLDPNVVKMVTDSHGRAIYFSRSPIPFPREAVQKFGSLESALAAEPTLVGGFKKHTGLYVYRREYLLEFTRLARTSIERTEMLEQMRAVENGAAIFAVEATGRSIGVDTPADLERVRQMLAETARGTV
jgi:3-deoxy-manno-octulosonate cytidylyltransferase (CMP-KDO synthetase)